ncbi:MAG: HK97 family phage prohead protease [Acidimicrobiales bacterium]
MTYRTPVDPNSPVAKAADVNRSARKPRMTRDQRSERQRVETRAGYKESREDRVFAPRLVQASSATTRGMAVVAGDPHSVVLVGQPCVYDTPYSVTDAFGEFTESVKAGAFAACLKTCDARLLFDHRGLPLARVSAGTLTLVDTKQALTMTARLDARIDKANALALAIERRDVQEMSIGFRVGADVWNEDMTSRLITRVDVLHDCSAVAFPASPTTSIELLEQEEPLDIDAGPTGDQGGNQGGSVPDNLDGTGSRSRRVDIDLALARARRPLVGHAPARPHRPVAARARRVDIDAALAALRRPI